MDLYIPDEDAAALLLWDDKGLTEDEKAFGHPTIVSVLEQIIQGHLEDLGDLSLADFVSIDGTASRCELAHHLTSRILAALAPSPSGPPENKDNV